MKYTPNFGNIESVNFPESMIGNQGGPWLILVFTYCRSDNNKMFMNLKELVTFDPSLMLPVIE